MLRIGLLLALSATAMAQPAPEAVAPAKVSSLALLPKFADCVGQMDVPVFARWAYADRFVAAMPQFVPQLRRVGMFPLAGVHTVSGAALRTGDKQGDAVFVVEADSPRAEWTAIGDGRYAAGAPRLVNELIKRAKRGGSKTSSLAEALTGLVGASKGACTVTAAVRMNARKEWPEVDSTERVTFTMDFDSGFKFAGTMQLTNEAAATSLLTRMQAATAKIKGGMGGMFNIRALLQPLSLTRNGTRIEIRYAMTPALLDQALSVMRLMRDLSESSGDSVR